jgi:single-strand DNA-binding protein
MANLNKVMLIGRLTRDPETRMFANGGKVAKFGLAVNYMMQKRNPTTGEWEGGETAFIDIETFNRPNGRQLADLAEQRLRKGQQVFVEGRLRLNEWTDKDGQKRSKLLVVADGLEFLEPRSDSGGEGYNRVPRAAGSSYRPAGPAAAPPGEEHDTFDPPNESSADGGDNIPF